MNSEELNDLRAAGDEARLAVDAIDSAIARAEAIAEDEQAAAVILFRGEAERRLRSALSKLKPEGAALALEPLDLGRVAGAAPALTTPGGGGEGRGDDPGHYGQHHEFESGVHL